MMLMLCTLNFENAADLVSKQVLTDTNICSNLHGAREESSVDMNVAKRVHRTGTFPHELLGLSLNLGPSCIKCYGAVTCLTRFRNVLTTTCLSEWPDVSCAIFNGE